MAIAFLKKTIKSVFVIANLIIAIGFLMGCYAKLFPPQPYWFVGLFTLASFYLFILLLLFFIGWSIARSKWALLFIIVTIIAWKPLLNIIPLRSSSPFTIEKQPGTLRIMSWNVESFVILKYKTQPELREEMFQLINEYQPDIACFQEMTCADSSTNALYQLKDLLKALPFRYYFYSYNVAEDYYPATHTHYGKIIFSKIPLINKQTVVGAFNEYNNTFEYVDAVNNSDTFRVFNCHLQTMKFTEDNLHYVNSITLANDSDIKKTEGIVSKLKHSFPKRQVQADHIKAAVNKSPYPVILCGDFNDVPNSYAYTTIGEGLQNAFEKKGIGIGRTFSEILPTLRIDNIFLDQRFTIQQYARVKKKLSDHYPIITDVTYKP